MNWHDRVTALSDVARLVAIAAAEGAKYGPLLLNHPRGDWRGMMRSNPHYRSYGTLQFLLEKAREKFETSPTVARGITAAVLDFVDQAEGPSYIHEIGLRGLAWKEHANACEKTGDLSGSPDRRATFGRDLWRSTGPSVSADAGPTRALQDTPRNR